MRTKSGQGAELAAAETDPISPHSGQAAHLLSGSPLWRRLHPTGGLPGRGRRRPSCACRRGRACRCRRRSSGMALPATGRGSKVWRAGGVDSGQRQQAGWQANEQAHWQAIGHAGGLAILLAGRRTGWEARRRIGRRHVTMRRRRRRIGGRSNPATLFSGGCGAPPPPHWTCDTARRFHPSRPGVQPPQARPCGDPNEWRLTVNGELGL